MANPDGTPIWFELTTGDQDGAERFYKDVAGWTVTTSDYAEHGGYRMANAPDGQGVGGIRKPPPGMAGVPGWTIYFAAADVDAMAATVKELGGQVLFGPMDIPHVGRFATVSDPQGVSFQIMMGASPEDSQAFRQATPGGSDTVGHGVWIEIATPDPDAAFDFYGELFGWTKAGAMPMGDMGEYALLGAGEARPGAVMSSTATGAPARWNWYVHVPDIDAAIDRANANGGTLIQGPDQIPGGDYSANLVDPEGNQIGLVGPRKEQ